MEDREKWLIYTYWGSYLKEDYLSISLDVVEILMKHWGIARRLNGWNFDLDNEGIRDIDSIDKVKEEVLNDRDHYELYDVTFFNPSITEEIYVNRLNVNKTMLRVEEYDELKYFQTDDPALNEQRTQALLEVFTDVASLPAIEELWMGDEWNAFMGKPAYLYRPKPLYDRVYDTLYTLKTKNEVEKLVQQFERYVPSELVMDFLNQRLGAEAVREMGNGKIRVLFYNRELTRLKADPKKVLSELKNHVDNYCRQKGVTLYPL
ncbi:hypothetical protein JQC72_04645 [Polycladomyces sp. WAk]|uniref:Uncharacterized protein n=1 Tax=Polycladomyces zharkentensis TaxID=2807616 RepID=A0ABS2WH61_9BACL|nr:hypothetical protein [Polycladomyces sp. WAk]MBN2908811.1 hypothetical protein [Polycladomyces sp. WAk]